MTGLNQSTDFTNPTASDDRDGGDWKLNKPPVTPSIILGESGAELSAETRALEGRRATSRMRRIAQDEEETMQPEEVREIRDEIRKAAALEKLFCTLERTAPRFRRHVVRVGSDGVSELSQLTRLHSAHASYSLETSEEVERVAPGAYMLQRKRN